jgi:protein TonB
VGGNVQESKLLRRVEPVYPELARQARVSGPVMIEVTVDESGNVSRANVIRGHPLLNDAALDAIRQWKYSPTLLNGVPVPVTSIVAVVLRTGRRAKLGIDPVVASLIGLKGETRLPSFVRAGNVYLELTLSDRLPETTTQLRSAGFEVLSWKDARVAVGRIPWRKVEGLFNLKMVRFIAPHREGRRGARPRPD